MKYCYPLQSVPGVGGDKEEDSGLTREEQQEQERLRWDMVDFPFSFYIKHLAQIVQQICFLIKLFQYQSIMSNKFTESMFRWEIVIYKYLYSCRKLWSLIIKDVIKKSKKVSAFQFPRWISFVVYP